MLSLSLYRHALRLYPGFHREQFGEEMIALFRELQADMATKGRVAQGLFCVRETAGVVAGALREHWRVWGGEHVWLLFSSRRIQLVTEFRFLKDQAVSLPLLLWGDVLA